MAIQYPVQGETVLFQGPHNAFHFLPCSRTMVPGTVMGRLRQELRRVMWSHAPTTSAENRRSPGKSGLATQPETVVMQSGRGDTLIDSLHRRHAVADVEFH